MANSRACKVNRESEVVFRKEGGKEGKKKGREKKIPPVGFIQFMASNIDLIVRQSHRFTA